MCYVSRALAGAWVIEGHAAAEVCVVGLRGLRASPHQVEQLCPCLLGDEGHWVLEFLLGSADPDL